MNKIKVFLTVLCFCFLTSLLTGCMADYWIECHPASHPGATYVSLDGNITLFVSEEENAEVHRGYFVYDGETIDVVFTSLRLVSNCIRMQTIEQYEYSKDKELCSFRYSNLSEDEFVVVCTEDTKYFEENEKITFKKIKTGTIR